MPIADMLPLQYVTQRPTRREAARWKIVDENTGSVVARPTSVALINLAAQLIRQPWKKYPTLPLSQLLSRPHASSNSVPGIGGFMEQNANCQRV